MCVAFLAELAAPNRQVSHLQLGPTDMTQAAHSRLISILTRRCYKLSRMATLNVSFVHDRQRLSRRQSNRPSRHPQCHPMHPPLKQLALRLGGNPSRRRAATHVATHVATRLKLNSNSSPGSPRGSLSLATGSRHLRSGGTDRKIASHLNTIRTGQGLLREVSAAVQPNRNSRHIIVVHGGGTTRIMIAINPTMNCDGRKYPTPHRIQSESLHSTPVRTRLLISC